MKFTINQTVMMERMTRTFHPTLQRLHPPLNYSSTVDMEDEGQVEFCSAPESDAATIVNEGDKVTDDVHNRPAHRGKGDPWLGGLGRNRE